MKRCSTLTIEEIQIKPAMIYNFTSIRTATVRETDLTSVGENVEKWYSPTHCCYRSKHSAALENRLAVLKKVRVITHTSTYVSKKNESMGPKCLLHTTRNCQETETH